MACDFRVGVSIPKLLGLHFTQLGIHAGMGGSHFLRMAIPSTTVQNEILLAGKILSGQEAWELGLLNRLVVTTTIDDDDKENNNKDKDDDSTGSSAMMMTTATTTKNVALDAAQTMAQELFLTTTTTTTKRQQDQQQQVHPVALRMMVQTLRAQQDVGLQQALQREAMAQAICYNRHDWGEGVNAVAEKRFPQFDGYYKK